MKLKSEFNKLCAYAESVGYEVNLNSSESTVDLNEGVIRIHHRLSLKNKLYTLLHELGHISQSKRFNTNSKYGAISSIMDLEIDAWKRGEILAFNLGIDIDINAYYAEASKCIYNYCVWASKASKAEVQELAECY